MSRDTAISTANKAVDFLASMDSVTGEAMSFTRDYQQNETKEAFDRLMPDDGLESIDEYKFKAWINLASLDDGYVLNQPLDLAGGQTHQRPVIRPDTSRVCPLCDEDPFTHVISRISVPTGNIRMGNQYLWGEHFQVFQFNTLTPPFFAATDIDTKLNQLGVPQLNDLDGYMFTDEWTSGLLPIGERSE